MQLKMLCLGRLSFVVLFLLALLLVSVVCRVFLGVFFGRLFLGFSGFVGLLEVTVRVNAGCFSCDHSVLVCRFMPLL